MTPTKVTVTKRWFLLPYRRYYAPALDEVSFGGDWGEPDGAISAVVRLAGRDVCIGSRKTMHLLYEGLRPLTVKAREYERMKRSR